MSASREEVAIFSCGEDRLVGIVHHGAMPGGSMGVLVIVGGPQYRVGSHRQFTLMARALARTGIPVMRFDYRGMGDSDGTPLTFESIKSDICAAIDQFMHSVPTLSSVVLWGLCDAASAALMDGTADPRVCGLILVNPWVKSRAGEAQAYLKHYYVGRFLQRAFWGKLLSGGVNPLGAMIGLVRMGTAAAIGSHGRRSRAASFIDRMRAGLEAFRGPILVLISERDLTAQEFMDLHKTSTAWGDLVRRSNIQIERLAGADHTFSDRTVLDRAVGCCRRWLIANWCEQRSSQPSANGRQ